MVAPLYCWQSLTQVCYDMLNVVWWCVYILYYFTYHSGCHAVLVFNLFSSPFGQDLVPCVLLSFEGEQILMWRGQDWKSMYTNAPLPAIPPKIGIAGGLESSGMHYEKEWDKSHCICTTFLWNFIWNCWHTIKGTIACNIRLFML